MSLWLKELSNKQTNNTQKKKSSKGGVWGRGWGWGVGEKEGVSLRLIGTMTDRPTVVAKITLIHS